MTDTISSSVPARADVHPLLTLGWEAAREARTVVHAPLYGPPVVSLAPPAPQAGVLRFLFPTASAAAACWAMHQEPAVLTLTADLSDTTIALRYVVAGGDLKQLLDEETCELLVIEVPYLEVPA